MVFLIFKENKNTNLLLKFFFRVFVGLVKIPFIIQFDFYVRILYLYSLQAYSAALMENPTIIA